jgi:hypothetical protein
MDMYGGEEDTKKPWTEQETLLLLEVRIMLLYNLELDQIFPMKRL